MQEILYEITNQNLSSYEKLVNLYAKYIAKENEKIEIYLEGWFDANLSAVLGGICEKLLHKHKITLGCGKTEIKNILERNGFYKAHLKGEKCLDLNHSTIPYLNTPVKKEFDFVAYLKKNFFSHTKIPKLLEDTEQSILEAMQEVYDNIVQHSKSKKFYACGQYFHKRNQIAFCIVDTGIGFANSVNQKLTNTRLTSKQAIEWAIQRGNTTKKTTGGLGLSEIQKAIEVNCGQLYIVSGNAILYIKNNKKEYKMLDSFFDGVIVNMIFKTENNYQECSLEFDFEDLSKLF